MKQHLLGILLAVATCFAVLPPTHAQTDGDIVDRLNKALLVKLPAEFEAKVKEFAANDTIMRTRSATAFTEQFIIEQFKKDWGIDRQNQLLFIWSTIYSGITKKTLYDFLDDDNEARSDEYLNQLENINKFYESYKKGFKEYMEQKSAEYDRRSAEAQQRSAEAIKEMQKADSLGLIESAKYYNLCIKNPQTNDEREIEGVKNALKDIITNCKKYNIDYKAILHKELGDDEKVKEVLKFYGVE